MPNSDFSCGRNTIVFLKSPVRSGSQALRLLLYYYWRIILFPQQQIRWNAFVNWIPLRICVRSRNTQPYLNWFIVNSLNPRKARIRAKSGCKKVRGTWLLCSKIWKRDISSASEKAFCGFCGEFFCCWTPSRTWKRCFDTPEFAPLVSSQRRVTRSDVSTQIKMDLST